MEDLQFDLILSWYKVLVWSVLYTAVLVKVPVRGLQSSSAS